MVKGQKHWEKIGFLHYLSNDKKKKCSELYDSYYNISLKNRKYNAYIIPIIYRIVDNLSLEECNNIDIEYLVHNINNKKISFYVTNPNIDVEAEFCASYVKDYIQKIKDKQQEIKYYTYGFECPDVKYLKSKEQKNNIYNKLLNQFEEQLKKWIYE